MAQLKCSGDIACANAHTSLSRRLSHTESIDVDEDSGPQIKALAPMDRPAWPLKGGFLCVYMISTKVL